MLAAEETVRRAWRGREEEVVVFMLTAGLAFYGGGVRSAAFAIGDSDTQPTGQVNSATAFVCLLIAFTINTLYGIVL